MKKILVTGNNCFLASRFIENYKDKYEVIKGSHNFLDITDENKVFNFFKNNKIDIVFHTAAISDTGLCEKDPALCEKVNFEKLLQLPSGDYNFGSENNLSTYDVALKILEFLNIKDRETSLLIKDY